MPLLLFPVENVFFLKSESIPLYVLAVAQSIALTDMFKGVQLVMTEAQVVHSKVGRCPITSCCEHHVHHDLRHVELLSPWECRLFHFILGCTPSSTGGPILLLFELGQYQLDHATFRSCLGAYCHYMIDSSLTTPLPHLKS